MAKSKSVVLEEQVSMQQQVIRSLEIKLRQSIARANRLSELVTTLQGPRKASVMPRRQDDGTWSVYQGSLLLESNLDFPTASGKCRELSMVTA